MIDPFSTASELSDALVAGDISATWLVAMTLQRIARLDPVLHAFVRLTPDRSLGPLGGLCQVAARQQAG